jgi:hypothetical protein
MTDHVTIEIGSRGTVAMIEPPQPAGIDRRAFRRTDCGRLEWTHYADWRDLGERARFYGFALSDLPDTMTRR